MSGIITGQRNALNNWLRKFKVFINIDSRSYKLQESFLGLFNWGRFKPLPKLDYVLVFKSLYVKCESCSIDDYESNDHSYYQVSLVHTKKQRIIIHETRDKENAFSFAFQVGRKLQLKIRDSASTRGRSVWIE